MRRVKSFWRKETKGNIKYTPNSGSKKVFGVPLDPNNPQIPEVLIITAKYIEDKGLNEQNLFRVSGPMAEINKLKNQFDKGEPVDLTTISSPHVVTGVLKQYLRELHEPLFSYSYYEALIALHAITDSSSKLAVIKSIIQKVPRHQLVLLDFLISFLYRICKHSRIHKMDSANLSIVFAPYLMRSKVETPEQIVQDSPVTTSLVKMIIEHYQQLFEKDPFTGDCLDFETRPFSELFADDYVTMYETINLDKEIAAIYEEEVDCILQKAGAKPTVFDVFQNTSTTTNNTNNPLSQSVDEEPPSLYVGGQPNSLIPSSQNNNGKVFRLSISSLNDPESSPDVSLDSGDEEDDISNNNNSGSGQNGSSSPPINIENKNQNGDGSTTKNNNNTPTLLITNMTNTLSASPSIPINTIISGGNSSNQDQIGVDGSVSPSKSPQPNSPSKLNHSQDENTTVLQNDQDEKLLAIKKLVDDSICKLEKEFLQLSIDFKTVDLTLPEILLIASSMKNIMNVIKEGPDVDFKVISNVDMDTVDVSNFTSEGEQAKRLETLKQAIQHRTERMPSYLEHFKEEANGLTVEGLEVDKEVCLVGLVHIMRTVKAVGDILDFFFSKWRGGSAVDESGSTTPSMPGNGSDGINGGIGGMLYNGCSNSDILAPPPADEQDIIQRLTDVDVVLNDIEESITKITSKSELIYIAKIVQNIHRITKMPLNQKAVFDEIPPPKINTLKVTPKNKLAPLISVVYVLIKEIRDDITTLKSKMMEKPSPDTVDTLKSYGIRVNDINILLRKTPSWQKVLNSKLNNNNNNNNSNSNNSSNSSGSNSQNNSSFSSQNQGYTLTSPILNSDNNRLSTSPTRLGGMSLFGKVMFDQLNTSNSNLTQIRNMALQTIGRMKPLLDKLVLEINRDDIALDQAMKISRAVTQMKKALEDPDMLTRTGIILRSNPSLRSINLSNEVINQQSKESKINALKTLSGVLVDNIVSKLDSLQESIPTINDEKNMSEIINLLKSIIEMIRDVNRSLI